MSDRQRDFAYLSDMLERARLAVEAAKSFGLKDLTRKSGESAMLERWIEIIGEAARRVSAEFKMLHPEIPWQKIIATRNVVAHDYESIRYEVIWRIATIHLPELIRQLEPLVPSPMPDPEPEVEP